MCSTLLLSVLISMIGCVELITVSTSQKYVNVTVGESALLQCNFSTTAQRSGLTIEWEFVSHSSMTPQQVYYYQSGNDIIAKAYQGRIQAPASPANTSNASIIINNMQTSDAGVYSCDVHNFPDVDGQSQVTIIVNVLETPSKPFCAVHGDVASGHLVTLTCHSEHGSPSPTYTWTRLDEAKTRRAVLGKITGNGVLQIGNISQFQFGEYQCNATNAAGYSYCIIELNADVPDGVIAGAVIGALLGFVLILLIVWFVAHTVKKHKYKSVQAEDNEMKKRSPQAKEAPDSVATATNASSPNAEGDEAHA